tara:strand:- start:402 stop:971 length:570 start_codon:yes stop_codon:yes gene_type:complete
MSSIKLTADTGGGTFEIKAPSTSANTRILTLPDTGNLTLGGPYGKLLQIPLFAIKTDLYSTSTTGSFTDIPGLSLTITPSSTSSKILIFANICHSISDASDYAYRLLRGSTALGNSTVGSEGNRVGISCGTTNASRGDGYSIHFLDSPNTTSATTYKIQVNHQNGTYRCNSRSGQWDGSSTIAVMEVGA